MDFAAAVGRLAELDTHGLHGSDVLLTWDLGDDEVRAVLAVADALRALREANRSCRVFDSGLDPYALLLRVGVQPARPAGAGPRRGQLPGRPR